MLFFFLISGGVEEQAALLTDGLHITTPACAIFLWVLKGLLVRELFFLFLFRFGSFCPLDGRHNMVGHIATGVLLISERPRTWLELG